MNVPQTRMNTGIAKDRRHKSTVFSIGRSGGIRTRGLMDPNHARYQASPHPDNRLPFIIVISSSFVKVFPRFKSAVDQTSFLYGWQYAPSRGYAV